MDFARKELEKYGWKDGEGLGKEKNGISAAIKPKLKFDTRGLGHSLSDEFVDTWWKRVYDEAARNVQQQDMDTVQDEAVEVKVKKTSKHKRKKDKQVCLIKFETKSKKVKSEECKLSDEELFKACGGLTAHKGARHGLKMNAKLERLRKQEEQFKQQHQDNS